MTKKSRTNQSFFLFFGWRRTKVTSRRGAPKMRWLLLFKNKSVCKVYLWSRVPLLLGDLSVTSAWFLKNEAVYQLQFWFLMKKMKQRRINLFVQSAAWELHLRASLHSHRATCQFDVELYFLTHSVLIVFSFAQNCHLSVCTSNILIVTYFIYC